MTPSTNCLNLIKKWESCRLQAYQDVRGIWTIGWGHTGGVEPNSIVTQDEADAWLAVDVTRVAFAIDSALLGLTLNQNQFDACVSLSYNIGAAAFLRSTLCRCMEQGDFAGAAAEFPKWSKATIGGQLVSVPGLLNRRRDEQALFEAPGVSAMVNA